MHRTGASVVDVEAGLEREPGRAVHLVRRGDDVAAGASREAQLRLLEPAFVRAGRPGEQGDRVRGERGIREAGLDGGERSERCAELLPGCLLYTSPSPRDRS